MRLPSIVSEATEELRPFPPGRPVMTANVTRKILTVEVPDQRSDRWCWAAVTVGIASAYGHLRFNGKRTFQCHVASEVLSEKYSKRIECCPSHTNGECDDEAELDVALRVTGNFSEKISGPCDWRLITDEIDARRPIAVRIERGGLGHFLVITGYRDDHNGYHYVYYDDPLSRRGVRPIESFTVREDGNWTDTYTTKGEGRILFRVPRESEDGHGA